RDYARKQQPGWIRPTLLSGWTASGQCGYYKDEFGIVHFSGLLSAGNVGAAFILPIGYRPISTERFVVHAYGGANYNYANIFVNANGIVEMKTSFSEISLSGITFRAEQ